LGSSIGVASVLGVIAGSCLAACRAVELRWEAFDDDHEMRRHLSGAALMGISGILVVHHSDFDVLIPSHSRMGTFSGGKRISMLLGTPG
tara:strand:- start:21 stop:287 length:267 start_codon:yes stop_codon:yes gene_type:complete